MSMIGQEISRDRPTASRAVDRRRSRRKSTVEMIGVKWDEKRHGNLRRRLRVAVAEDGADGYADWLCAVLDARDAKRRNDLRHGAHPLAI